MSKWVGAAYFWAEASDYFEVTLIKTWLEKRWLGRLQRCGGFGGFIQFA
jgi:hypothetical protein